VDNTAFLSANGRHSTVFATGVADLSGPFARLLDVVLGRSGKALCDWVSARDQAWPDRVDSPRWTRSAATPAVLDAFHVTRLGFAAVDDVRRRVQQDSLGHRGRRDDPRSSRSADCCAAAPTGSPTTAGNASSLRTPPATSTSRSG